MPSRAAWSSTVLRANRSGPASANGSTGTANPMTSPARYLQVRPDSGARPRPRPLSRQPASSTAAGSPAQNLTDPAAPMTTPAHSSRRGEASRPSRKAAAAPMSRIRFIHGSRMRLCAVVMSSG
ncbi:MAG: hypothetical protein FWE35_14240 [Streptosporangiales bacterium]|nr:hypothetical protein [Streptosporangiales bacterium]